MAISANPPTPSKPYLPRLSSGYRTCCLHWTDCPRDIFISGRLSSPYIYLAARMEISLLRTGDERLTRHGLFLGFMNSRHHKSQEHQLKEQFKEQHSQLFNLSSSISIWRSIISKGSTNGRDSTINSKHLCFFNALMLVTPPSLQFLYSFHSSYRLLSGYRMSLDWFRSFDRHRKILLWHRNPALPIHSVASGSSPPPSPNPTYRPGP